LSPLSSVGTDLMVARTVGLPTDSGPPSEDDLKALLAERTAADRAAVIDLSRLGKPGGHFEHDFFLPATALTFPADKTREISRLPGVAAVASGLTMIVSHREGTVPDIIADYQTPARTIEISPPTPLEDAAQLQCLRQFVLSLPQTAAPPGPKQPPPAPSGGFAQPIPYTRAYYQCLPERFRHVAIQQEIVRRVIDPPQTDISTTAFTVAGVDTTTPRMGLLTPAQIVQGSFFGSFFMADPAEKEAILEEAYARRQRLAVGSNVVINETRFRVIGLAKPPLGGMTSDVYVPLADLQQLAGRGDRINVLMIKAAGAADVNRVSRAVALAFPGARVASARDVAAQVTGSLVDAAQVADRVGRVLALLVLAAAFWIATVLTLSSVSKRVRELGTLRALGWRTSRLVRQITAEALVLAVVGGLLGIALGMAATFAVNVLAPPLEATAAAGIRERLLTPAMHRTTRLEAQADSLVILLGLGLAVGGVIAGAAGSFRAAQLRPAVALRHRG
jgi:hypothetical protein